MHTVIKDFSWAHRHVDIKEYKAGESIEFDDADLISVAEEEGWIEPEKDGKSSAPAANKARRGAPESKAE